MKGLILAAGLSKRLQPLTNNLPKCLLTIGEKTILDHQLEVMTECGIRDVIIVIGFKGEVIKNHLKNKYQNLKISFIKNDLYRLTGPAYSLWCARKMIKHSLLYLNSDVIFPSAILHAVIKDTHESTTAIQNVPWDEEEVNVMCNQKRKITEIGKHITVDKNNGEFIGVTKLGKQFNKKLQKALLYFMKKNLNKKFAADAINLAIQKYGGRIYAVDTTAFHAIEIDTIEDYEKAKTLKI